MKTLVLAVAAATLSGVAAAAAPVSGSLVLNGQPVKVVHVAALLDDQAEGVRRPPLQIVFSDRPVPPDAIDDQVSIGVQRLAASGGLRGLLLRLDPAEPNRGSWILLEQPLGGQGGLVSATLSSREGPLITNFKLTATTVSGRIDRRSEFDPPGAVDVSLTFEAKIQPQPAIVADLKGAALQASPHYKLAAAYAAATARADLPAMRSMSAKSLRDELDAGLAAAGGEKALRPQVRKMGAYAQEQLPKIRRLVDRGARAMLVVDEYQYLMLVKENGEWRMGS